MNITNNLHNIGLALVGGCIITVVVCVFHIIQIIRVTKMKRIINQELFKIDINNLYHKEKN